MTASKALQLEKMAALEKSSREQMEKVMLLEARVEALEQDNFALKDKASKLEEKVKTVAKEKKGISSLFCVFRVVFLCSHFFPCLDRAKELVVAKG